MWDLNVIVNMVSSWSLLKTWMLALHICNKNIKQSLSKFFFITFSLSTELLEDKQRFKLGGVDTSPTYLLFLTLFLLFWTLICMIWMKLTPDWHCSLAKLPWCCFCVEIKVLEMERNFARIFNINNKNERGPWVGTTHQGAPPSPGAPRWVVPTWWPRRRSPWYYKITYF